MLHSDHTVLSITFQYKPKFAKQKANTIGTYQLFVQHLPMLLQCQGVPLRIIYTKFKSFKIFKFMEILNFPKLQHPSNKSLLSI